MAPEEQVSFGVLLSSLLLGSLVTSAGHMVHLVAGSTDGNPSIRYVNVFQYWCWLLSSDTAIGVCCQPLFLLPARVGPEASSPFPSLPYAPSRAHAWVYSCSHSLCLPGHSFPSYLLLLSTVQLLGVAVRLLASSLLYFPGAEGV